jgi:hypothetical protein
MTTHVNQPLPVPNGTPTIQSLVRADLELREQVGVHRYGTALQARNGRDAARDLYEELLDATCYLRQVLVERIHARQALDGIDTVVSDLMDAGQHSFASRIREQTELLQSVLVGAAP